jgi:hypothetical protein
MRLAGVFVAVVLAASASTAKADPLPFEIVRLLPETNQVLVYDRAHNTHVLLQPGSIFEDYSVIKVSELDMVVEKAQQQFTVYPREARLLSLTLFPRQLVNPPIIYGKAAPGQPVIADTGTQHATLVVADGPVRALPHQPTLSTNVTAPRTTPPAKH